jgi:hypothetical protein
LTYWGFDEDLLTSMWLALSPANEASGVHAHDSKKSLGRRSAASVDSRS